MIESLVNLFGHIILVPFGGLLVMVAGHVTHEVCMHAKEEGGPWVGLKQYLYCSGLGFISLAVIHLFKPMI